jgi:hypothetical protein
MVADEFLGICFQIADPDRETLENVSPSSNLAHPVNV